MPSLAGDVLKFHPTELGGALGALGVDAAVAGVTGVVAALHGAALGGGGRCLQDRPGINVLAAGSVGRKLQGGEVGDPGLIDAAEVIQEGVLLVSFEGQQPSVEVVG
jgi:hypothetical protein